MMDKWRSLPVACYRELSLQCSIRGVHLDRRSCTAPRLSRGVNVRASSASRRPGPRQSTRFNSTIIRERIASGRIGSLLRG
jgi:hypothetical protein